MDELSARLVGHGLHVLLLAGGYSLATREEYGEVVRVFLEPKPEELSRQALETLAIIAYRQPITRPQVEAVRGVNSAGAVRTLLEKGLVRTAGRDKGPGRACVFVTTREFLSLFGLAGLEDLPPLSDDAAETLAQSLAHGQPEGEPVAEEEAPFEFDA
jgi:segregation and condensation protein B